MYFVKYSPHQREIFQIIVNPNDIYSTMYGTFKIFRTRAAFKKMKRNRFCD